VGTGTGTGLGFGEAEEVIGAERDGGLEGEQHLELVDVQADLRPQQDQRRVPLRQARPHEPPPDVPGAAHHQHPAWHGWRVCCSGVARRDSRRDS
jgi:hypothetical protein